MVYKRRNKEKLKEGKIYHIFVFATKSHELEFLR